MSTCLLPAHRDLGACLNSDTHSQVEAQDCVDEIPLKLFMKGEKLFAESGTPACESDAVHVR